MPEDNSVNPAVTTAAGADQGLVMIETPEQSLGHQPPMVNGQDPTQQQIPFPAPNLEALNFTNEVGLNYFSTFLEQLFSIVRSALQAIVHSKASEECSNVQSNCYQ